MKTMTLAQHLCDWVISQGIDTVFAVPGYQIDYLIEAFEAHPSIKLVFACHEQGAAYMADGYAIANNKPGICLSIGSVGTLYLIGAASNCRIEKSPVLFITGDNESEHLDKRPFQDTGVNGSRDHSMFTTAIDHSYALSRTSDFAHYLKSISEILQRSLPAHLSIPRDKQRALINSDYHDASTKAFDNNAPGNQKELAGLIYQHLETAHRPLFYIGQRLNTDTAGLLLSIMEQLNIPVITNYAAKGIVDENHVLSFRNIGFASNPSTTWLIENYQADCMVTIGIEFNMRDTDEALTVFDKNNIPILQIIHDNKWADKNHASASFICSDINLFLEELQSLVNQHNKAETLAIKRLEHIHMLKESPISWNKLTDKTALDEIFLIRLNSLSPPETRLFVDAGEAREIAGRSWAARRPNSFFTCNRSAPMGWPIAAAIGGKIISPAPCFVFTGDGSMRMLGLELATAAQYNIPVIFIVSNNNCYKTVQKRLNKPYSFKLSTIDWVTFANSLGIESCLITNHEDIDKTIEHSLSIKSPLLIEIRHEHC